MKRNSSSAKRQARRYRQAQRGAAMGIALLMTLVFSTLLVAALMTTRGQLPLSRYHTSSTQAYYLAEKGLQKSALWFTKNFTTDPAQTGRFVLPMRRAEAGNDPTQYLSYVDPEGTATDYNYNVAPVAVTSFDTIAASVKITDASGRVRNVVLSADATENTYPDSYPVSYGSSSTRTISGVVSSFVRDLGTPQRETEGTFTIKAMLVAVNPPNDSAKSAVVWRLISKGVTADGAEKTLVAELGASAVPWTQTVTGAAAGRGFPGGIISRGALRIDKKAVADSYRSELGAYGTTLAAGSFTGQEGNKNIGINGDLHSNGFGKKGIILVKSGSVVKGDAEIVTQYTGTNNAKGDPIREEKKGNITGDKEYGADWIDFYDVAPIPTPASGSTNYKTAKNFSGTLPSGSYNKIDVDDKATLTVPGGTYGELRGHKDSTIILGTPGQVTKYNLQKFKIDDNVKVIINGPVILNIQKSLKFKGDMEPASGLRPDDIHFNVQDDRAKKDDPDIEDDDADGDGVDDSVFVDDEDTHGGKVKIEKGRFYGVLYAPGSKVDIKKNAEFFGAVVGYQIKIKQGSQIHVDESLKSWVPDPTDNTPVTIVRGYSAGGFALRYK
jgi:Tfp pilus assembly protein PilX